jgi:hypothetical protein
LSALKTALNSVSAGKGDTLTASAQTAVGQIQSSAKTLGLLVDNLNTAATTDLKPLVDPAPQGLLTGSFGDNGSLKPLVAANKAVNSLDGTDGMTKGVAAGLKLPTPANNESLSAANGITPDKIAQPDQKAANDKITTAQNSVTAFLALTPDKQKADPEPGHTQGDIDGGGQAVRQVQADQSAVDAAAKTAAATAAGRVQL